MFAKISSRTLKQFLAKKSLFQNFFDPLNTEINDFESLKVIAKVYGLSEEIIDKIEDFKTSEENFPFFYAWEVLKQNLQEKYNFRIAFLEGNHCAMTVSSTKSDDTYWKFDS